MNSKQPDHKPRLPSDEKPLQSWKEIAAYLDRDVRTAIRWENEEALPVRRHRTGGRGSVYAYPAELDAWRAERKPRAGAARLWTRWAPALAGGLALLAVAAMVLHGPILNPPSPLAEAAKVENCVDGRHETRRVFGPAFEEDARQDLFALAYRDRAQRARHIEGEIRPGLQEIDRAAHPAEIDTDIGKPGNSGGAPTRRTATSRTRAWSGGTESSISQ